MLANWLEKKKKVISDHQNCIYWQPPSGFVFFPLIERLVGSKVSSPANSRFHKAMCFFRAAYGDIAAQTYGVIIQPTQIWHSHEFIIFCFAPGAWKALPLSLHRACHRCWCIFLLHGQVLLWKLIQLHDRISRWIIHALHAFCTRGLEEIHTLFNK